MEGNPLIHMRGNKIQWIPMEMKTSCKITSRSVHPLPSCHVGMVPRSGLRRAKRRDFVKEEQVGHILLLVEIFMFLPRAAEDISQGGLGSTIQQPSSMKLHPLLVQRWFADSHLAQPSQGHQHKFGSIFLISIFLNE